MALTLHEATQILEPPIGEQQLQQIVRALGWHPTGARQTGRPGHPCGTYDWDQLCALHAAITPFLKG